MEEIGRFPSSLVSNKSDQPRWKTLRMSRGFWNDAQQEAEVSESFWSKVRLFLEGKDGQKGQAQIAPPAGRADGSRPSVLPHPSSAPKRRRTPKEKQEAETVIPYLNIS